jgi:hypothetical protein
MDLRVGANITLSLGFVRFHLPSIIGGLQKLKLSTKKPSTCGTLKQTDFTCGVRPKENITRENIFHRKYPHEERIQ